MRRKVIADLALTPLCRHVQPAVGAKSINSACLSLVSRNIIYQRSQHSPAYRRERWRARGTELAIVSRERQNVYATCRIGTWQLRHGKFESTAKRGYRHPFYKRSVKCASSLAASLRNRPNRHITYIQPPCTLLVHSSLYSWC